LAIVAKLLARNKTCSGFYFNLVPVRCFDSEQEAISYKLEHPKTTFRWLEEHFGVKKDRIWRRFKDLTKL
jgi:hypothetical protein